MVLPMSPPAPNAPADAAAMHYEQGTIPLMILLMLFLQLLQKREARDKEKMGQGPPPSHAAHQRDEGDEEETSQCPLLPSPCCCPSRRDE